MTDISHVQELAPLRARIADWRAQGLRIAFVPTMGALHDGHMSLVRLARERADRVVVSIFVNPTQFAPGEDFEAYPRDVDTDAALLASEGVELLYLPDRAAMYAPDHSTTLRVGGVGDGLETDHRPTFFHGVALVVTKLLLRVLPDIAVFGEKDYQQLAVIRRMVRDLDIPVGIVGAPIARDAHGLALSSRNRYFDAHGLRTARALNRAMHDAARALSRGEEVDDTLAAAKAAMLDAGFASVDYVTLADASSLSPITRQPLPGEARLLVAAHCPDDGSDTPGRLVRLIDNCAVRAEGP